MNGSRRGKDVSSCREDKSVVVVPSIMFLMRMERSATSLSTWNALPSEDVRTIVGADMTMRVVWW